MQGEHNHIGAREVREMEGGLAEEGGHEVHYVADGTHGRGNEGAGGGLGRGREEDFCAVNEEVVREKDT